MKAANSKKTAKKPPGIPFKKGKSGNPEGRPKLPPEIKAIRQGSKEQIIEAYGKYSHIARADLDKYPPLNLIEEGVRNTLINFASEGETQAITKLWDQVHGKATESIQLSGRVEMDSKFAALVDEILLKRRTR
jgi:hypothetical protein